MFQGHTFTAWWILSAGLGIALVTKMVVAGDVEWDSTLGLVFGFTLASVAAAVIFGAILFVPLLGVPWLIRRTRSRSI